MDEQIEQIARALLAIEDSWNDHDWEQLPPGVQELFRAQARAAHSVMAGTIAELRDVLRELSEATAAAMRPFNGKIEGGNPAIAALFRLNEAQKQALAALAPPRHD